MSKVVKLYEPAVAAYGRDVFTSHCRRQPERTRTQFSRNKVQFSLFVGVSPSTRHCAI
ncbi:hypothetical protein DAPPUDRAFT_255276 [Daphnia pulex]|uniref:Uncharacterized protein n=1 Tax=Daphnia pulex TaxID=6669 RepID=E9H8W5_DAPPU|nr:hypothetical protein DAPPUDRAFT_255276 [Daphnia pulex]|eukprot:EFX71792.1 hypothetical protein DAPPUDRAFT_255276 [Daphnia pulex]